MTRRPQKRRAKRGLAALRPPSDGMSAATRAAFDAASARLMAAGGIKWPESVNDWLVAEPPAP